MVDDLQSWVGALVVNARMPTSTAVVLEVKGRGLLAVEQAPLPSLHVLERAPPNPRRPFSFQGLLRARCSGPILAVRCLHDDRIVEIEVPGGRLHARLFGLSGGIWWLEDGRAVASASGPTPEVLPPVPHAPTDDAPPRFGPTDDAGWAVAAGRYHAHVARLTADLQITRHVTGTLRKRLTRVSRLVANLGEDLGAADRADTLVADADALAAVLHRVPRGAASVEVPDLGADPPATRVVALDPARPASETLQRWYAKASRLRRAADDIVERLVAAEADRDGLVADLAALDAAEDLPTRASLARRVARQRRLPAPAAPHERRAPPPEPWTTWLGPGGGRIRTGRSAEGNYALVFRASKGRDTWVHLRERPGAHAVVSHPAPHEAVLAAAQLLLAAARVAPGEAADVQVARVADVRPAPGPTRGRVIVQHERVLHVVREDGWPEGWTRDAPAAR